MLDKAKKSPDWAFSIVIPIEGKAEPAATLVPEAPVKNVLAKVTALLEVPEAITELTVSVLLSSWAVYPNCSSSMLCAGSSVVNSALNLNVLPINVPLASVLNLENSAEYVQFPLVDALVKAVTVNVFTSGTVIFRNFQ